MKTLILNAVKDLCSNFLYYDRKEDDSLSIDQLNNAITSGEITVDEIVTEFRNQLEKTFKK